MISSQISTIFLPLYWPLLIFFSWTLQSFKLFTYVKLIVWSYVKLVVRPSYITFWHAIQKAFYLNNFLFNDPYVKADYMKHNYIVFIYIPWHSLIAVGSKMVINNSDLHVFISNIAIIMTKKHNFVLISKPIVWDGNVCRTSSDIKKTILGLR